MRFTYCTQHRGPRRACQQQLSRPQGGASLLVTNHRQQVHTSNKYPAEQMSEYIINTHTYSTCMIGCPIPPRFERSTDTTVVGGSDRIHPSVLAFWKELARTPNRGDPWAIRDPQRESEREKKTPNTRKTRSHGIGVGGGGRPEYRPPVNVHRVGSTNQKLVLCWKGA